MEGVVAVTEANHIAACHEDELPQLKVTHVTKIQHEHTETPVSSAGEDDDVKDFFEMLREDPSWEVPPTELETKIRTLLEHYFSDENLLKDKFLLKHIKRNRLGYVSVKLLTSFKKLKTLSRSEWKITAYSLSKSDKLELNKSGTKVRRKVPLPEIDLPTTSIKTLLYKLQEDSEDLTLSEVTEQFRMFGELTTVRIIRPDKEVPADLRNHTRKHPELGTQTCVVVEFESTDSAQNAYKTLSKQARDENKPDMYSLLGSGRNPRKQVGKAKSRDGVHCDSSEDSSYVSSRESSPLMRRKFIHSRNGIGRGSSPLVSPQGSRDTSPERSHGKSPSSSPNMSRKKSSVSGSKTSGKGTRGSISSRKPQPKHSPHYPRTSPLAVKNSLISPGDPGSGTNMPTSESSPWLQRRRQFVASQGNSPASTPGSSPMVGRKFQDGVPLGVKRLPRGPPKQDSKGFETAWRQHVKATVTQSSKNDVQETAEAQLST